MAGPKSVRLSNRSEKVLEAVEARFKDRLREAIRALSENTLLGKKLKGEFEELRSYRVGPFHIVCRITKGLLEVVYIDHRKDVYR